jgi:ABC-type lipoprotein release transport system permease subunit
MSEILRNLARRKLRSALTVSGIVIGIFALTTMGALAEHFNSLLDVGVQYSATAVRVGPPDGQQTALIPLSKGDQIRRVAGVAAVYPSYQVAAEPGGQAIQMGPPMMISNENRGASAYGAPAITIASGRDLAESGRGEVVLGAALATELGRKPATASTCQCGPRTPSLTSSTTVSRSSASRPRRGTRSMTSAT